MRRAAPALPNGFTLGNLFFGIFAIISASRGEFGRAVLFIVLGGVCDAFDGAVARATRSGSKFGEELDSLVDAISFGLAPAMIVYFSVLREERMGPWAVFFFAACAVLRLARFNVTQAGEAKSYFVGLPSPAAGGTLATYWWFTQTPLYNQTRIIDLPWQEIMVYLMLFLAILMISPVPYPAWPKVGVRSWRAFGGLLLVLGIVLGAAFYSKYFFFLFGVSYVAYGLLRGVVLGLLERQPGRGPRRRASDFEPLPDFPPPVGADATAFDYDIDESDEAETERYADDGRDGRRSTPAGDPAAVAGHDPQRRRRKRRRARGERPPPGPAPRPEDPAE